MVIRIIHTISHPKKRRKSPCSSQIKDLVGMIHFFMKMVKMIYHFFLLQILVGWFFWCLEFQGFQPTRTSEASPIYLEEPSGMILLVRIIKGQPSWIPQWWISWDYQWWILVNLQKPSGNCQQCANLKMTQSIYSGFTHWTWWFSIVMLVYQRVSSWILNIWGFP